MRKFFLQLLEPKKTTCNFTRRITFLATLSSFFIVSEHLDNVFDSQQVGGEEAQPIGESFGERFEGERRQQGRGLRVDVVSDVVDVVVAASVEHSRDERRDATQARHRDADGRQEAPQRL